MSFGVLTLNLWNINEPLETRYRALEAGLKLLHLDIICLQEVYRDPKSARPQSECIAAMCNFAHCAERDGLAILSANPIVKSDGFPLPEFPSDPPRLVLITDIPIEGRPLQVINTHLAYPPEMVRERQKQVDAYCPPSNNTT